MPLHLSGVGVEEAAEAAEAVAVEAASPAVVEAVAVVAASPAAVAAEV